MIAIIAAIARNGTIGDGGKIPWHLPADLRLFKTRTMGGVLIMGRKTFESIGSRALPGRRTIVVTRRLEKIALDDSSADHINVAASLHGALLMASTMFTQGSEERIFICGGSEIYRAGLEVADRLFLTRIDRDYEGDVRFPEWDESKFHLLDNAVGWDEGDGKFTFQIWSRK